MSELAKELRGWVEEFYRADSLDALLVRAADEIERLQGDVRFLSNPDFKVTELAAENARLTVDLARALEEVGRRSDIIGRAAAELDLRYPERARKVLQEGFALHPSDDL